LAVPLLIMMLLGTIEFAFLFNATLSVNFASRNASLIAAEAGSRGSADCLILQSVERDLAPPTDRGLIQAVKIFKADRTGAPVSGIQNIYVRDTSTSLTCGSVSVPYRLSGSAGYASRCDRLSGCLVAGSNPAAYGPLDSIGVQIQYRYRYVTPLRSLIQALPGSGSGQLDIQWSNVMRMEPIL
jgi:hypothetical protein